MDRCSGFVADGYDRARATSEFVVRSEVEREFVGKLHGASTVDQKRIRREIDRKVEKRLDEVAPRMLSTDDSGRLAPG